MQVSSVNKTEVRSEVVVGATPGTLRRGCVNAGMLASGALATVAPERGEPCQMEQHTGGDAVIDVLEQAGVEVVFGIPSVHNLPIYDSLRRRGRIRAITVRHEQAAAGAADAYARVYRAGRTSSSPRRARAPPTPWAACWRRSSPARPVLHLTGQVETRYPGRTDVGFIHEVPDQPAMLASLSKAVQRAETAGEIAAVVAAAIVTGVVPPRRARSAVELPIDLQYADTPATSTGSSPSLLAPVVPVRRQTSRRPSPSSSRAAGRSCGPAVAPSPPGAEQEVAELVHRLGAGLLTSPNGRGVAQRGRSPLYRQPLLGRRTCGSCAARPTSSSPLARVTRARTRRTGRWRFQQDSPDRRHRRNGLAAITRRQSRSAGDAKSVLRAVLAASPADAAAMGADPQWREQVAGAATSARSTPSRTRSARRQACSMRSPPPSARTPSSSRTARFPPTPGATDSSRWRRPRRAIMPNGFAIGLGLAHALGAAAASARRYPVRQRSGRPHGG